VQKIESKEVAEKVEQIVKSKAAESELAHILAAVEKINHRLEKLEAKVFDPESSVTAPIHSSQERFEIAEAVADAIFEGIQKEKACTFEPNGKPCDHCSMCSARGF